MIKNVVSRDAFSKIKLRESVDWVGTETPTRANRSIAEERSLPFDSAMVRVSQSLGIIAFDTTDIGTECVEFAFNAFIPAVHMIDP